MPSQPKKEKTDYVALSSPFMHIPRMDVRAARALLDLRIREVYELKGRDPAALFEEFKKKNPQAPADLLKSFIRAVKFAEEEED